METPKPSPPFATPSSTSPSTNPAVPAVQKNFSCVLCSQRKVKCDKTPRGCSNCNKARVQCIYRAPPPPRRRKRKGQEVDTATRIKLYEAALRRLGVNPADITEGETSQLPQNGRSESTGGNRADGTLFDGGAEVQASSPEASPGRMTGIDLGLLVVEEGKSRYLENNLWTSLKGEFRDPTSVLEDSSDEEEPNDIDNSTPGYFPDAGDIILGSPRPTGSLHELHPQPVQIFRLWQIFLDNVHPLIKVFHTPTVQQLILNSIGNLAALPKNLEALMFAIYCGAVNSLSDTECDGILGRSKIASTRRFRTGTHQALVNASVLTTSDMMVLQAFVLYLLSLNGYEAKSLWILTGVAVRLGRRTGLHRDGETLGLSVFDTEMRRRLWWQINLLDASAEKLAGTGTLLVFGDTKMPSNLNDSDLFPDMKELPKEHEGPTEMMFFLIRCHVGDFLKRSVPTNTFDGSWSRLSGNSVPNDRKDKAIDDFEDTLERKFLRYCDESIPWHFMAAFLGRAVVCTMRFVAHNPYQYEDQGKNMPEWEKDMLFSNCLRVISYQNLAVTRKGTQGFAWHVNTHFQWKAFIYVLHELRRRGGEGVDEAWKEVELVYEFHPHFITDGLKRALPFAVGNLTIKAWEAYRSGKPEQEEPHFIKMLRSQRPLQARHSYPEPIAKPELQMDDYATSHNDSHEIPVEPFQWGDEFASSFDFSANFDPLSPSALPLLESDQQWESLLHNFQMQKPSSSFSQGNPF